MGQTFSAQAARVRAVSLAARGWPAFMTEADARSRMSRHRVEKSLLGRRLRFSDVVGGCTVEYARLARVSGRGRQQLYQRVDGPCGEPWSTPKFPVALAVDDYRLVDRFTRLLQPGPVVLQTFDVSGQCATYRLTRAGPSEVWVKTSETSETCQHVLRRYLRPAGRDAFGAAA